MRYDGKRAENQSPRLQIPYSQQAWPDDSWFRDRSYSVTMPVVADQSLFLYRVRNPYSCKLPEAIGSTSLCQWSGTHATGLRISSLTHASLGGVLVAGPVDSALGCG